MKQIFTCTAITFCLLLSLFTKAQMANSEPLADDLLLFNGTIENAKAILSWQINKNETYNLFEVEKSSDGINFTTNGIVFTSDKPGTETYKFKNNIEDSRINYFRLKVVGNNNNGAYYSKIITIKGLKNSNYR